MQTIQLSVEEGLSYKGLADQLDGFVLGAQAMAEHVKKLHIKAMLDERQKQQIAPPNTQAVAGETGPAMQPPAPPQDSSEGAQAVKE
jgi:hypothetical protein